MSLDRAPAKPVERTPPLPAWAGGAAPAGVPHLNSPFAKRRAEAARRAPLGEPELDAPVVAALWDRSRDVRMAAAAALGERGGPSSARELLAALQWREREEPVRSHDLILSLLILLLLPALTLAAGWPPPPSHESSARDLIGAAMAIIYPISMMIGYFTCDPRALAAIEQRALDRARRAILGRCREHGELWDSPGARQGLTAPAQMGSPAAVRLEELGVTAGAGAEDELCGRLETADRETRTAIVDALAAAGSTDSLPHLQAESRKLIQGGQWSLSSRWAWPLFCLAGAYGLLMFSFALDAGGRWNAGSLSVCQVLWMGMIFVQPRRDYRAAVLHTMTSIMQRHPTAAAAASVETVARQMKNDLIIPSGYERNHASRILDEARSIREGAGPDLPLVCEVDGGQLPRVHETGEAA